MTRFALSALLAAAIGAVAGAQNLSASSVSVSAAFAPNAFGSSNYDAWRTNTINALVAGTNQSGTPNTSSYYNNIAGNTYTTHDNIVTDFDSWRGMAPGTYSPELGTRTHFPVKIVSSALFSLSQVQFAMHSTDSGDALQYTGDLSGTNFGTLSRRGVYYGADGVAGGGDDVVYNMSNPGSDATLINELEYVGVGNAFEALSSDPGATNQQKIDGVAATIDPYVLNTTYSITGQPASGTAGVSFLQPVPEPASLAVLGLGAIGLLRRRARKN